MYLRVANDLTATSRRKAVLVEKEAVKRIEKHLNKQELATFKAWHAEAQERAEMEEAKRRWRLSTAMRKKVAQ
jgi:hypothetical protein